MKKILVFLSLIVPLAAGAAYIGLEQNGVLAKGETVSTNLYAAGSTVTVAGNALRDAVVGAGSVLITGTVGEDLFAGAGVVDLFGDVGGDARVGGGKVTVGANIGGDFVVGAGSVTILPKTTIKGDFIGVAGAVVLDGTINGNTEVKAGQLSINGTINGSVNFEGEELVISSNAVIDGNVVHTPEARLTIKEGAVIKGETKLSEPSHILAKTRSLPAAMANFLGALFFFKLIATVIAGILAVLILKNLSTAIVTKTSSRFGRNLVVGIVAAVVGPILAFLLCVSLVGSMIGILLALILLVIFIAAQVYAGVVLGAILFRAVFKNTTSADWKQAIVGVVIYYFLWFIPLFGGIIAYVFVLATFGSLLEGAWLRLKDGK